MTFDEWFEREKLHGSQLKLVMERAFKAGAEHGEKAVRKINYKLNKVHAVACDQNRPLLDRIKDIREISLIE